MKVALLVFGCWLLVNAGFLFGAWWASRHKWDDEAGQYARGYDDGWHARGKADKRPRL